MREHIQQGVARLRIYADGVFTGEFLDSANALAGKKQEQARESYTLYELNLRDPDDAHEGIRLSLHLTEDLCADH